MSTFLMTVAMVSVNALVVKPPSRMELSRCTKWYGANVGCCVGFKDGRGVGEMLGADVGHEVGMRVGCSEGTLLGDIVGDAVVGRTDKVGISVGAGTGFLVGASMSENDDDDEQGLPDPLATVAPSNLIAQLTSDGYDPPHV